MIKFFISQSYFIISEKRDSSFSDAIRTLDAQAIPTTICRLGYPRLVGWLLYKVGNRCSDIPCPAACYKAHGASLHIAPHPLRSSC